MAALAAVALMPQVQAGLEIPRQSVPRKGQMGAMAGRLAQAVCQILALAVAEVLEPLAAPEQI